MVGKLINSIKCFLFCEEWFYFEWSRGRSEWFLKRWIVLEEVEEF